MEMNGTVAVRKVWDGRAWLEEIEADGPNGHWEGMTLFTYNPQAHQWSQNFVDSQNGVVTSPLIGDSSPARVSKVVDFPAPFAPRSATTSPGATLRFRPRTTAISL